MSLPKIPDIKFNVPYDHWNCAVCEAFVGSEAQKAIELNKEVTIWPPVSRYWSPDKKFVFCGAEHSLEWHKGLTSTV